MSREPYWSDEWLTVYQGDCREVMRSMEPESVHCVVTSPPYWGLRDYGTPGQLGLEPTPEEYVANMVEVFREVRRVLRSDGTVWLNLGDSYAGPPPGNTKTGVEKWATSGLHGGVSPVYAATLDASVGKRRNTVAPGLKPKDLVGIPWRVAFALQADGWYLRSDIIWAKPNPMPESVTDRPTKSHEYIFLLSKSPRYFFDADAVREGDGGLASGNGFDGRQGGARQTTVDGGRGSAERFVPGAGRNLRSVWTIATQPYGIAKLPNRVGPDGRPGKVSPDCPVHSPRATLETARTGEGDGRLDPDPSSSPGNGARPGLGLAAERLASSSLGSSGGLPSTTGSGSLGSSDSPTPGSAPVSRTPSRLTGDDGPAETAQSAAHTSRSPESPTSPAHAASSDADVATRRSEPASRTSDVSELPDSASHSTVGRTPDRDDPTSLGRSDCSCPKYISTSHFATFPRKLVEPCIKAGTSERGVCPECGAPWVRVVERGVYGKAHSDTKYDDTQQAGPLARSRQALRAMGLESPPAPKTTGWRASCGHGRVFVVGDPVPATVLDPFAGSGTTALVAQALGRRAVLIDLSTDYLDQIMARNAQMPLPA